MYVMGDEYAKVYEQMSDEVKAAFEAMTDEAQLRYIQFWIERRPDHHAAHRDTLPSFLAGWDAGQNDLLRRFNLTVQNWGRLFIGGMFEGEHPVPKRRRKSA